MKLIENWQDSWKWISTQCFAGIASISLVWATVVPADVKVGWVEHAYTYSMILLSLFGTYGRNIQQTPVAGVPVQKETPPQ